MGGIVCTRKLAELWTLPSVHDKAEVFEQMKLDLIACVNNQGVSMRVFRASASHCHLRFSRPRLSISMKCRANHLVRSIGLVCQQAFKGSGLIQGDLCFYPFPEQRREGVSRSSMCAPSTGEGARIIALTPEALAGSVWECKC